MCNAKPGKRSVTHARKYLAKANAAADALLARPGVLDPVELTRVREALARAQVEYDATDSGRMEMAAATTRSRRAADGGDLAARAEYDALGVRQATAGTHDRHVREQVACMPDPTSYNPTQPAQRAAWERLGQARYEHAMTQTVLAARYLDGDGNTPAGRAALLARYQASLRDVAARDLEFRTTAVAWQTSEQRRATSQFHAAVRAADGDASPAVKDRLAHMSRVATGRTTHASDEQAAVRDLAVLAGQNYDPALTRQLDAGAPLTPPPGWEKHSRPTTVTDWATVAHLASDTDDASSDVAWSASTRELTATNVGQAGMRRLWRAGFHTEEIGNGAVKITRAPDLGTWAFLKTKGD